MNNPADTLAALAPCPFCGHSHISVIEDKTEAHLVVCEDCISAGPPEQSEAEAIAAWNRRASLKGEAVVPALEVFRIAGGDVECCPNPTAAEAMDCLRDLRQCYEESLATPPAPQAGLSAWVSEMKTSAATEYWVCVGWGRNFGEYMTVRMSHMRNRSELEVAEWNHLFGKGTKPCIADPKFRDPEQVSSTPSPAPQGGGEQKWCSACGDGADRTCERCEGMFATPPAQQPGEVGEAMIERAKAAAMAIQHNKEPWFPMTDRRLKAALRAALAPKEKGNG